jgi:methionine-S-sulfoxide reductase
MTSHSTHLFIVVLAGFASAVPALDRAHSDTMTVPAQARARARVRVQVEKAPDTAYFAGGSFWCLEPVFETLPGVDSVTAGYAGGSDTGSAPDFESVSSGNTGYVEAVRVIFHPQRIGYARLLDAYWKNIDPTRADGQFTDEGQQFHTVIYFRDQAQKAAAEASRKRLAGSKRFAKPIVTGIEPAAAFHAAEAEHQDYYKRNTPRYRTYLKFSGREAFFRKAWGAKAAPK